MSNTVCDGFVPPHFRERTFFRGAQFLRIYIVLLFNKNIIFIYIFLKKVIKKLKNLNFFEGGTNTHTVIFYFFEKLGHNSRGVINPLHMVYNWK